MIKKILGSCINFVPVFQRPIPWAYARGGGSMGSNDPPSPKRGHLHHWNFFSNRVLVFYINYTLLVYYTLCTNALIQSTLDSVRFDIVHPR